MFDHQQEQKKRLVSTGFIWSSGLEGDVLSGKKCSHMRNSENICFSGSSCCCGDDKVTPSDHRESHTEIKTEDRNINHEVQDKLEDKQRINQIKKVSGCIVRGRDEVTWVWCVKCGAFFSQECPNGACVFRGLWTMTALAKSASSRLKSLSFSSLKGSDVVRMNGGQLRWERATKSWTSVILEEN